MSDEKHLPSARTTIIRERKSPVTSLSKFLSHVTSIGVRSTARFPRCPILFRGHRLQKYPLIPVIARDDLYTYEFRMDDRSGEDDERYMLDQFKRLSPPLLHMRHDPANDFEWLALARHYGMATRLLDWTENALAALWFAVKEVTTPQQGNPVVWVFLPCDEDVLLPHELEGDPLKVTKTRVYQPPHFEPRIRSQTGWFTVHAPGQGYPCWQQFDVDPVSAKKLCRINIEEGYIEKIRKELQQCGVTALSIYPDLLGLCEHLNTTIAQPWRPQKPCKSS